MLPSEIGSFGRVRTEPVSPAVVKFNTAFAELGLAIADSGALTVNGHTNAEDLSPSPVTQPLTSNGHLVAHTKNHNSNNDEP